MPGCPPAGQDDPARERRRGRRLARSGIMRPMAEAAHGFSGSLRSMDLRVFQERELGLDVVLSGPWAILPCALAMALGTVFLLAVFQAIPRRRHSIPVLLGLGLLAAAIGLAGAYLQY